MTLSKNKWLRSMALQCISANHPNIEDKYVDKLRLHFNNQINNKNSWLIIFIIVIIVFIFGVTINIDGLNLIDFQYDDSKDILEKRIANIVTLLSMTFAVVGFLMSNLALKESYSYKLLFKSSNIYPIIYFSLSTIICLFLISLFRKNFSSEYLFSRLVLIGIYLSIITLILIGYLFSSLIRFTNREYINGLLKKQLFYDLKHNLKILLIQKYSNQIWIDFLKENNVEIYNVWLGLGSNMAMGQNNPISDILGEIKTSKYVKNINLNNLQKFINKNNNVQLTARLIKLDGKFELSTPLIWVKETNNFTSSINKARTSIKFYKKNYKIKPLNSTRKYFDFKLEEYARQNNYRYIEEILNIYEEVYHFEMLNSKHGG